ncbi:MAG TPA: hypothetical protein VH186_36070 [Chloroflexia bacterium]|nr:hypothetical protein [Chloroflexia bacterium]
MVLRRNSNVDDTQISFYTRLQFIRERPLMFLTERSLSQLLTFLWGYSIALKDRLTPESEEEIEFFGFHQWVCDYYKEKLIVLLVRKKNFTNNFAKALTLSLKV